jgi:hypothetical protein
MPQDALSAHVDAAKDAQKVARSSVPVEPDDPVEPVEPVLLDELVPEELVADDALDELDVVLPVLEVVELDAVELAVELDVELVVDALALVDEADEVVPVEPCDPLVPLVALDATVEVELDCSPT